MCCAMHDGSNACGWVWDLRWRSCPASIDSDIYGPARARAKEADDRSFLMRPGSIQCMQADIIYIGACVRACVVTIGRCHYRPHRRLTCAGEAIDRAGRDVRWIGRRTHARGLVAFDPGRILRTSSILASSIL